VVYYDIKQEKELEKPEIPCQGENPDSTSGDQERKEATQESNNEES
jgi:hypothetical protein